MRRIIFLIFAIASILGMMTTNVFSQEITVRFTGQLNGTDYCRLDRVVVTNLTRNWSEIVEYPDTIIVLGGTVGANLNIAAVQGLGQNIPNPFDCETRVELSVSQREDVRMQLLDVAGKVYAEYNGSLDAGVHTFDISAANPQTYLLNAIVGDRQYSIRMVNVGSGCGCSIKYAGVSGGIEAKLTSTNEFQIGDNMRYVGYAIIDGQALTSTAVEQAQYVSQYVTLQFVRNERPVVQTLTATEITSYSATLNGNVVFDGGTAITARGFFYGTSSDNMSNNVTVSAGNGEFSIAIENLSSGTTYYFRAYATNEIGTAMGETLNFTTQQTLAPTVVTLEATNVSYTTATINGSIVDDGGAEITERGFFYGSSADNLSQMITMSGEGTDFSSELSGLNASTTYYFKAFATNENGTSFGELKTFTTFDMIRPNVVTLAASNITITSATLNGSITENIASVIALGFQIGISENDLSVNMPVSANNSTFSMDIPGLEANTTYYFRAYATDEFGQVYGQVMNFTTASVVAPTVNTLDVTEITHTSATLSGSITSDGGASVTECGFRYSTSPLFSSYETVTCQSVSSNFAYSLNGLNAGTTYYVKAYATNSIGTAFGEVRTFTTDSYFAPSVTTLAASGITVTSATLNGTIVSNGGAEISERGFIYSASPVFGTYFTITSNSETDGFSADISELLPSTTYYFKAYATNSIGTTYGDVINFTTLAVGNPSVETYAATNVSYTTVTLNASVISDGGATITGRGFYYGTSENNLTEQITAGIGASNFNVSLTNLADNTTYYFKAYATNSVGTAYGNTLSFTTDEIVVPTVATMMATEITRVSAKLNGEITSDGGADVTTRGFIYSSLSSFATYETINTELTSNEFYANIESLSPITTYYYKAFAINSHGTSYGETMQFTTLEFYLPTVETNDATNVTVSSATLNGNITSDGGSTVTAKGFQYGTSADNLTGSVSLGMGAGTISTTLSDLNDNTTYYYRAYASNNIGTAYGDTKTFTTIEIVAPTVATLPATGNTRTTVTLNASITSDGGAEVTARGFYWGTVENDLPNYVASNQTSASFSATVNNLEVNTTYYYCAVATNISGTSIGDILSTRTNPLTAPTVVTNAATNITQNATLNATITDDGGTAVTARGFYWGTSADNLVNNAVSDGTTNNFTANITGLIGNTIYYYCAYATNSTSTAIGSVRSFCTCGGTITDIDGNQYGTVLIGEQCWMAENLRTTRFANGTSIPLGNTVSESIAYRYNPNNNSSNVSNYGYLYNWKAAMHGASSSSTNPSNVQGICPNGWHLPSDAEWRQLSNYLGENAAPKLAGNANLWESGNLTNSSYFGTTGFNGRPAGRYTSDYESFRSYAGFWSTTESTYISIYGVTYTCIMSFMNSSSSVVHHDTNKYYGVSVRCVRD